MKQIKQFFLEGKISTIKNVFHFKNNKLQYRIYFSYWSQVMGFSSNWTEKHSVYLQFQIKNIEVDSRQVPMCPDECLRFNVLTHAIIYIYVYIYVWCVARLGISQYLVFAWVSMAFERVYQMSKLWMPFKRVNISNLITFEWCIPIAKYHENCNAMSSFTVLRHVSWNSFICIAAICFH